MAARVVNVRYLSILLYMVIIGAVQCQNVLTNTNWFNLCPKTDYGKEWGMKEKLQQLESKVPGLTKSLKKSRTEIQLLSEKLDRLGRIQSKHELANRKLFQIESKVNELTAKIQGPGHAVLNKRLDQLENKMNELDVNTTKPRNEYVNRLENTYSKNESMRRLDQIENTLYELAATTNKSKCEGMERRLVQVESKLNELTANTIESKRKSVDKKVDQIAKRIDELTTNTNESRRQGLDSRLDKIESKLNELATNINDFRPEGSVRGLDQTETKVTEIATKAYTYESRHDGCLAQVDVVFILDSSSSVGEDNFYKMLNFCKNFLTNVNIGSGGTRVGIESYSTDVYIECHLNTYDNKTNLFEAIDNIPWRFGSTNTADALFTMHSEMFTTENGDSAGVPNIVIIVTDGVSNINSDRTIPEAVSARAKGIHVYAVGIGLSDTGELNGIGSVPAAENVFLVQSFDELEGLDEYIMMAVCR